MQPPACSAWQMAESLKPTWNSYVDPKLWRSPLAQRAWTYPLKTGAAEGLGITEAWARRKRLRGNDWDRARPTPSFVRNQPSQRRSAQDVWRSESWVSPGGTFMLSLFASSAHPSLSCSSSSSCPSRWLGVLHHNLPEPIRFQLSHLPTCPPAPWPPTPDYLRYPMMLSPANIQITLDGVSAPQECNSTSGLVVNSNVNAKDLWVRLHFICSWSSTVRSMQRINHVRKEYYRVTSNWKSRYIPQFSIFITHLVIHFEMVLCDDCECWGMAVSLINGNLVSLSILLKIFTRRLIKYMWQKRGDENLDFHSVPTMAHTRFMCIGAPHATLLHKMQFMCKPSQWGPGWENQMLYFSPQ